MKSADFKDFWDKMAAPAHAHSSDFWFDRYGREIMFYLTGAETVVDAGCGSGEILMRIAPHFKKVIAIDYSESMLNTARRKMVESQINHVDLFCDNISQIESYCTQPVDAIFSNGVIQYLSQDDLDEFVSACKRVLKPGGKLILFNIPNVNNRILFMLGFYKHEKRVTFYRVLKGFPRLWLRILRFKITNGFKKYNDGIGNWFSIEQMKKIGLKHGLGVQIYGSSVVNYYYRFHVVLTDDQNV